MGLLRNRGKKQPVGLHNASSSCYVNSVLQCLTYSPPLANYCLQRKHLSTCPKFQNGEECPMCLLEDRIVRSLSEANVESEAPETITTNLKIFASYLSPNEQTDAQEFLDCVINACEESDKSNEFPHNDRKVLNKMFQSVQKTIKRCIGCNNSSNSDEIVNYFPIPLSQPDGSFTEPQIVINLKDSLRRYFSTEYIKPSGPCSKCKGFFSICIEPSISMPPNVLLLTLQRFWVDMNNFYNSKKISNVVSFPESLQLTEYLTSPNPGEQYVYSLYAIICHQGIRMSSGHYIAYVKDADNCWFRCNDEIVTPATMQDVLQQQQNVYMLFFIRETESQNDGVTCNDSTRPLSLNCLVTTVCENSSNDANGYEASSQPQNEGQDEGIMKVSELITTMCENSTKTADGSSSATIIPEAISKPDCEGRGKDIFEGSDLQRNKRRSLSLALIPNIFHVSRPATVPAVISTPKKEDEEDIFERSASPRIVGSRKRKLSLSPIPTPTKLTKKKWHKIDSAVQKLLRSLKSFQKQKCFHIFSSITN